MQIPSIENSFWLVSGMCVPRYQCRTLSECSLSQGRCRTTADSYHKADFHHLEAGFWQDLDWKTPVQIKHHNCAVLCINKFFNIVKNDSFYEQLNAIQNKLSKGGNEIVIRDLNAKVGSDNFTLYNGMSWEGMVLTVTKIVKGLFTSATFTVSSSAANI